ncbi:MAG: histidine kinase [Bacteroidales bacterium]|nr:histidine kinase [Bacteroidales bacterium]
MMKNTPLQFFSRLSLYTWRSTITRIVLVGSVGLLFLLFASTITLDSETKIAIGYYLKVALAFILLSESNVALDHLSEKLFPIPEKITIRIVLHFALSLLLAFLVFMYFEQMVGIELLFSERIVRLMLALGIIFIFIMVSFALGVRIIEKWMNSRLELEKLKEAKLKSDYNTLQEQLNPHFLFNNLSVLKSLIMYDSKTALEFVQNFTDVYRYVLQSRGKTTVKLKEEIEFIESYIAIHKERHGENMKIKISVEKDMLHREIPPLTLQLLVENALKHNIVSKSSPLEIDIFTENNKLIVQNNLQVKETGYSTRSGLSNLVKRYEMLTGRKVNIMNDNGYFRVETPLL